MVGLYGEGGEVYDGGGQPALFSKLAAKDTQLHLQGTQRDTACSRFLSIMVSIEVMQAHHVGALKEDTNGRHVAHTITDRDPESGAWRGRGVGGKGHPLHSYRNLT